MLGDGFDLLHRQWGLRGDPHIWSSVRDIVGSTPTPAARDEVRTAFVSAIAQVADIDIDDTDELHPHRTHLDHGGMSGGMVDVEWWRTKGVPLLVDRAWDRRPARDTDPDAVPDETDARPRNLRNRMVGVLVWLVVLAIPAGLVGGGSFLLYQRARGTRVDATVMSCDTSGGVVVGTSTYRTECVAEWEIDGRVVVGGFTGGNGAADVGRTVDATVRGDTAYSRSVALPLVLLSLGAPFLALPVLAFRSRRRDKGR